ncbi:MAG TPA: haloacid dehalogenase, partial [Butyricimonas virosa]|nr:haloacid dehalogenase [Butyricimonas virosa]
AFIKLGLADADTRLDKYHQTGIFQELEEGKLSVDEFRKQLGDLCG